MRGLPRSELIDGKDQNADRGEHDGEQDNADEPQGKTTRPPTVRFRQQRVHRLIRVVEIRARSLPEQLDRAHSLSLQRQLPDVVVYFH